LLTTGGNTGGFTPRRSRTNGSGLVNVESGGKAGIASP
jgi:hypothetical protein